jgi:hypothetical protein
VQFTLTQCTVVLLDRMKEASSFVLILHIVLVVLVPVLLLKMIISGQYCDLFGKFVNYGPLNTICTHVLVRTCTVLAIE